MIFHTIQEARDREKEKPKIKKARIAQEKRERHGIWIKVEHEIKPYYKFIPNKKKPNKK